MKIKWYDKVDFENVTEDIHLCPRCNKVHILKIHTFIKPAKVKKTVCQYWSWCDNTDEPIFIFVKSKIVWGRLPRFIFRKIYLLFHGEEK